MNEKKGASKYLTKSRRLRANVSTYVIHVTVWPVLLLYNRCVCTLNGSDRSVVRQAVATIVHFARAKYGTRVASFVDSNLRLYILLTTLKTFADWTQVWKKTNYLIIINIFKYISIYIYIILLYFVRAFLWATYIYHLFNY